MQYLGSMGRVSEVMMALMVDSSKLVGIFIRDDVFDMVKDFFND